MTTLSVVFMQVSHKLTAPKNPVLEYYERVYSERPGYHMPEHFMEIPTWIAVISGMLPEMNKRLHVVTNVDETIAWAEELPEYTAIMMSVMDVNKAFVHELVSRIPHGFVLGGYVDPEPFKNYENVTWLDSVQELAGYYDRYIVYNINTLVDLNAGPDYGLFKSERVIPRLTLSEGCLYDCAFCTVERKILPRSTVEVWAQVDAMRVLQFELVYVDDKTFGQAGNWHWLDEVGKKIKSFNPYFMGFIVQTTVPMVLKYAEEWATKYHVRYIEVGVEHVDSAYLKRMKKPYTVNQLTAMMHLLYDIPVEFVPNLMFGLPGAEYTPTIAWVKRWAHQISFINPYILCQYGASKGALVERADGEHDQNENSLVKSWLTKKQQEDAESAMNDIFRLTGG